MESLFDFDSPKGGASAVVSLCGGALTPIESMSVDEFKLAADEVYRQVRRQAFSVDLPVIVKVDGHIVPEFADGRLEIVA
ncbi:hypothetical protein [Fibrella aquatica]|uniref:hypothetical protein n=1 Tax=Fibrella aquatica TaxID=3242487 RepID=UPI003521438A